MGQRKDRLRVVRGTIKKLVTDRGFGFIVPAGEQGGNDLFFYRNDVQGAGYDALREGGQVAYELSRLKRAGFIAIPGCAWTRPLI
jgi:cold shock CspA family protein